MPRKNKAKKFRRKSRTHGRGKKAGRGKGLKGGSGNAGLHKHRFATTVKLEKQGIRVFGRHGFVRHGPGTNEENVVLNVRDLPSLFGEAKSVDLGAAGYTKLLGGGSLDRAYEVKVAKASASAVAKIEGAGGSVLVTARGKKTTEGGTPSEGQS